MKLTNLEAALNFLKGLPFSPPANMKLKKDM